MKHSLVNNDMARRAMAYLHINQKVLIPRNDGRIHFAIIKKLDGRIDHFYVTVEWTEGGQRRGKKLPVEEIELINPHIYSGDMQWRLLFLPSRLNIL